jgi:hypothetical protein
MTDRDKYVLCKYSPRSPESRFYSVWFLDGWCFDVKCFLFYKNNVITKKTWPEIFDSGFGSDRHKERGEKVIKMLGIEIQS